MEEKISKVEIVVTVVLVVVICCGLALSIVFRVDKSSGELTMENYEKYLTVDCNLSSMWSVAGDVALRDYTVSFIPKGNYRLTDVTVIYSIYSESSNINGEYTATFSADKDNPHTIKNPGKWQCDISNAYPYWPKVPNQISISVISVTGSYEYKESTR